MPETEADDRRVSGTARRRVEIRFNRGSYLFSPRRRRTPGSLSDRMVRGWQKRNPRSARFQKSRYGGDISNRPSGRQRPARRRPPASRRGKAETAAHSQLKQRLASLMIASKIKAAND